MKKIFSKLCFIALTIICLPFIIIDYITGYDSSTQYAAHKWLKEII